MISVPQTSDKTTKSWRYFRRCFRACLVAVLLLIITSFTAAITQAADSEFVTIDSAEQVTHQHLTNPSTGNHNTLSFTEEQLRDLKFFLAGGIFTLLIVLICGFIRSSSLNQVTPSQVYAYQQPAQNFIPAPHPIPVPASPPTSAPPLGAVPLEGTSPNTQATAPQPHGMYYPSIPLSLSMPIAWQTPAYPATALHPQEATQQKPTSAQPEQTETAAPAALKDVDDEKHSKASSSIENDSPTDGNQESTAPKNSRSPKVAKTDFFHHESESKVHDEFALEENEHLHSTISPILGDIISHTRFLKKLR